MVEAGKTEEVGNSILVVVEVEHSLAAVVEHSLVVAVEHILVVAVYSMVAVELVAHSIVVELQDENILDLLGKLH